jgi:hypothetical protein
VIEGGKEERGREGEKGVIEVLVLAISAIEK